MEIIGVLIGVFAVPVFIIYMLYILYRDVPFPMKDKIISGLSGLFHRSTTRLPREIPNVRFEGIGEKLSGLFKNKW